MRRRIDFGQPSTDADKARLKEMLDSRRPPGLKGSERAFLQGHNSNPVPGVPAFMADRYVAEARTAGINPTGRVYKSGLADHRGASDPHAWVSGLDDVARVCRERNLNCSGAFEHKAVEMPPQKPIPLAEDLIQGHIKRVLASDPGRASNLPELRAEIVDRHGRQD